MKKNNIEELKQMLEELYRTQQARLDAGADDLDIREEIAKVEEEIKELQDETMEEDSIKNERSSIGEDIKILESIIKINNDYLKGVENQTINQKEIKALEHLLSDCKRVLKENEILKKEKEQAWEEWNNLEQGSYETEQKLKQQMKELQRENEQLKERIREHTLLISPYYVKENYIPVQKIKDIINRINYDIKKTKEIISNGRKNDYQIVRLRAMNTKSLDIKKRLQELLKKED